MVLLAYRVIILCSLCQLIMNRKRRKMKKIRQLKLIIQMLLSRQYLPLQAPIILTILMIAYTTPQIVSTKHLSKSYFILKILL